MIKLEVVLKLNPVTTQLGSGMYALFYDPTLEKWVVSKGARKKTVLDFDQFDPAFRYWLVKTKQTEPPF